MFDNLLKSMLIVFQAVIKSRDSINEQRVVQFREDIEAGQLTLNKTHDDYRAQISALKKEHEKSLSELRGRIDRINEEKKVTQGTLDEYRSELYSLTETKRRDQSYTDLIKQIKNV